MSMPWTGEDSACSLTDRPITVSQLRVSLRLGLICLLTLFHLLMVVAGRLLMWPFPSAWARWRSAVFRSWCRSMLTILGVRVEIDGPPPQTPFLLVTNHLSYLDILVLGSQAGGVFVAKSELASWPVIGLLCYSVDTIFIDRTIRRDIPRVMAAIDRQLDLGQGVFLFAEGTSSKGATVLEFRPSLLEPAVRSRLPVSYAALSYHTPASEAPAHLTVCWWGDMTFIRHALRLAELRRITAKVAFGDRCLRDDDRKRLAEQLRRAVLDRFEPVIREEGSCVQQ